MDIDLQGARVTSAPTRPIRTYQGLNSNFSFSPDGRSLAYKRGGTETLLMIHSFETGQDREVPVHPGLAYWQGPRWSRDGRSIAMIGRDLKGRHGVFRIDVETGAMTTVVESALTQSEFLTYEGPWWSPDDARLYYHKGRGAIFEWTFATGTERELGGPYGPISLSPDGRYIAAAERSQPGVLIGQNTDLRAVIIPVAGGTPRTILPVGPGECINNSAMAWTPDSQAVLIHKLLPCDGEGSELWLAPIDGNGARKVDFDATRIQRLAQGRIQLSPDGRQLAYQADDGQGSLEVLVAENLVPAR